MNATDNWSESLADALSRPLSRIQGARGSALVKCLADLAASAPGHPAILIAAPDPEVAGDINNDLIFYLSPGSPMPLLWPAWDILPYETEQPDVEVASEQVAVLRALMSAAAGRIVIAPITALLQPTLSPKIIKVGGLSVSPGAATSPEALAAHLVEGGLEPVTVVEAPGQFSRRGGILDAYPLLGEVPYRIEFFGDEIDTIRAFDPGTQQSGPPLEGNVSLVDVSRDAFRHINGSEYSLLDYFPEDAAVIAWHPERISRVAGLYEAGFSGGALFPYEAIAEKLSRRRIAVVPDLEDDEWPSAPWPQSPGPHQADLRAKGWERLSGGFDSALNELTMLASDNVRLTVACNNEGEERRLRQMLEEKRPALLRRIDIVIGRLSRGFIRKAGGGGFAYVSDHELFGRQSPVRVARKRFSGTPIADFAELREGDYVVHVANGIARFEGMRTLERDGATQDYLTLRFAEDARIYVPLSHIDLVQRYIGLGGHKPQLSRLGSAAWSKKKEAAEKAVRDIAQDLLATQAKRLSLRGVAMPEDDVLVHEFDASFPYEETPDQLLALEDIRRDQQSGAPMDRLICGDVGFGKTEVAVRAAFRAVNSGKQAAVLVPTTILAEQHYRTFIQRMADYPVRVESLSRFRSQGEQKQVVDALKEGKVDVVVGTHRLLSQDVGFKDLGLVVIDEEQKFGVESKERLKRFQPNVDIITMTATPIPRTLHMSLLGLRDISNLATAPRERHSVKTMVLRWSKDAVRRAMLRELARGGQCFFLHNRVHNIDDMAARLRELVPEARFGIGHGQMAEGELLEVMRRFLDGHIDVLVCTTIIESGVDIPNVNTLFVNDADRFGLSELHQLRGRVGRYKHQAYAYFLVPEKRVITPEATKRLQALQEYAELGAGFRIAMRDLEIRGAGNLLGVEQSGHIHMVGFDLYCRLLEKAVAAEKGETAAEDAWAELDLGTRAFIPPEYIPAEQQRIEFYRRLTRIRDLENLETTRGYVRDRYGPLPDPVARCFRDQEIRIRMMDCNIESLGRIDGALAVGFSDKGVRRGVMLLRHAGFKITPLRKNQWRVEVTGADMGIEPGAYAAAMAERMLAVVEAGGREPKREADAPPPARKRRRIREEAKQPPFDAGEPEPKPAPGPKPEPEPELEPEPESEPKPAPKPEPEPESESGPKPEPLTFFSSDMLDIDPPLPPITEKAGIKAARGLGKKKKGKSGANAPVRLKRINQDESLPGGARKTARMPGTPGKPGIIALGAKKPPKAASAASGPLPSNPGPEPVDPSEGLKVLAIEPYLGPSMFGVVVANGAVESGEPEPETMTLVVPGDSERYFFLRYAGSTPGATGRTVLKMQARDQAMANQAAEAYLGAGEARLYHGIVHG